MLEVLDADDLFREELSDARAIHPDRKLVLGLEIFDRIRASMMAGIRMQFPEADEQEVRRILVERLELARRLEEAPQ